MNMIKKLYAAIVPRFIRYPISCFRNRNDKYFVLKKKIIKFLEKYLKNNKDPEKLETLNYLKNNSLTIFPFYFPDKGNPKNIIVYSDNNMKYIFYENKRMYFPDNWNDEKIQNYYIDLLTEQDINSPHRYETVNFCVHEGDIVADIGAAEGIFGLSVIERAKYLYLFECEESWTKALKKTFEPWKDKIMIINKYVSGHTGKSNDIKLDDFFDTIPINFIKADIEGAEISLLKGAGKLLSHRDDLRLVLCTYHKQNDEKEIKHILLENDFEIEFSKGFMIYFFDEELTEPYLRRGVIRAKRNKFSRNT